MSSLINAEHVKFQYLQRESGEPYILNDVSLNIKKGEFVAVLGHNACGKSTLLKHFNALLLPSGGSVYVNGIDTAFQDKKLDIRQTVGMIFQNPDNQIISTIVEEDVAFALENLGIASEEIKLRVEESLKAVDMYEYRFHAPHKLSGGQKQRIAIAGIIAMRPECIVLDEPTSMLDPKGRADVMSTIIRLNKEYGITIVLITHYMEEASKANRIAVMDKGKIILDGKPEYVFSNTELLKSVKLDVPQVTELIYRLRKQGINLPDNIISIGEGAEALYELMEGKHVNY